MLKKVPGILTYFFEVNQNQYFGLKIKFSLIQPI